MLLSKNQPNQPMILEKNSFDWFLQYLGMAAILDMWHRKSEQTFYPLTQDGFT